MEKTGKRNLYTCEECGGQIITENMIDLVTPFMVRCRAGKSCKDQSSMTSGFYPEALNTPHGRARWPTTHRWISYTAEEIEEYRRSGDEEMVAWATGDHGKLVEVAR